MGQKCCVSHTTDELESHKGALLTEASQVENQRLSLNLKGLDNYNSAAFYEEREEDEYNYFVNQETTRTTFRKNEDPERYIFNYKGENEKTQNLTDFTVEEVEEEFPEIPGYVKDAKEVVKNHLSSMSQDIDYKKTFKLKYKGNIRVCWFQGNKKSKKGTGYCRILSEVGEYYEGLIKNFQLLRGLMYLENGEFFFGAFNNNTCTGLVEQYCPNGDKFKGMMREGLRHGRGKIEWEDRSSYDGNFKLDSIHGNGVYTYTNGDSYDGHFVDGYKDGKGKEKNSIIF